MTLPVTRNTTYVAGVSQVIAADLNALQDAINGATPHLLDHFVGLNTAIWTATADGTGSVAASDVHTVLLSTGTTGANRATIRSPTSGLGGLVLLPAWRARVRFDTTVANRLDIIGLTDASFTEKVAFNRDTGISNNLRMVVAGGGGAEVFDTGFAPLVNTWYVLTAIVQSTTSVYWSIALSETAAPLASGDETPVAIVDTTAMVFTLRVETLTTASRVLRADYVSLKPGRSA